MPRLKKNQRLKVLKEDDPEYQGGKFCVRGRSQCVLTFHLLLVKKLFEEGWLHPNKPLPAVRSIFRLLQTGEEMWGYKSYRWALPHLCGSPHASRHSLINRNQHERTS
jgi:hypothetical protein